MTSPRERAEAAWNTYRSSNNLRDYEGFIFTDGYEAGVASERTNIAALVEAAKQWAFVTASMNRSVARVSDANRALRAAIAPFMEEQP